MTDIRNEFITALEQEIIGPCPNPEYIDEETGQELLLAKVHGSPQSRYGAALLYPKQVSAEQQYDDESNIIEEDSEIEIPPIETNEKSNIFFERGSDPDEEPVGLANQFKPSAMGFTVRFNLDQKKNKFTLFFKSAWYEKGQGQKAKKRRNQARTVENVQYRNQDFVVDYWIRRPLIIEPITLFIKDLLSEDNPVFETALISRDNQSWLKLNVFNRTTIQDKEEGFVTMTFSLINDIVSTTDYRINTANILFQNELILSTENPHLIAPYRERQSSIDTSEEHELKLLYRNKQTYAIGHGTAVIWKSVNEDDSNEVTKIQTAILPVYDMPQIAPTGHVELSMYDLSDFGNWEVAKQSLRKLESEYENWVNKVARQAESSPELVKYKVASRENAEKCKISLNRIRKGIKILIEAEEDSNVVLAFKWMNQTMLWQQQRSKTSLRKWQRTGKSDNINFVLEGIENTESQKFESLELFHSNPNRGRWRPFQLAFVLMNIDSIVNFKSTEREIVDLIWFPTGGGKTEAYLGLTAFSIFFRRLKGENNWNWDEFGGTAAIMRYTLRLLTTQQYERAASLICACDLVRKENEDRLGEESISIGLWVGGTTTPNDHAKAKAQFTQLQKDNNADYNFIVMKCPCCAAQIGKLNQPGAGRRIKGLKKEDGINGKVIFQCENICCEYYDKPLPLNVVDEYIYVNPPTLLLGTVDKFAMITWNSDAGKLFGFRENNGDWSRITPPELIIQDELHLIAGPLGTMVGLYETLIQTLCNNYRKNKPPFISEEIFLKYTPPKIIASSATISRAFEQVKALYAIDNRKKLNIFPAQGLSFGDTWFSEEKPVSEEFPGRRYIGVLAPGYPSMQTAIVRTYAAILQKVGELKNSDSIDYYWTLLGYFNSIRELGGASSLVYSDIRERLSQIHERELIDTNNKRYIRRNEELTSRISSSQIPEILKKLEKNISQENNQALDICLATNMVATGVDISRLGLMFIHGQPKTTAEYIQASSRVGREVPGGPGIIISLYSPSKPRDKSQYEQFYSYHSRIYANVEPTSVTPFSVSARQRALHAIIIGLIRHFSSGTMRNFPTIDPNEFSEYISVFRKIILNRCEIIDSDETEFTGQLFDSRINFWKRGFERYGDAGNYGILKNEDNIPLMYSNSAEVREDIKKRSLATPTSMRGVDSESKVGIITNSDII